MFASLLAFLLIQLPTQAQQRRNTPARRPDATTEMPANLLKINFISLVAATGSFFYERVINERMSAQLGVQFTSYAGFFTGNERLRNFAFTPEFRYYLTSLEAPKGFYVAPFLRYRESSITGDVSVAGRKFDGKATVTSFGGGVLLGGQFLVSNRVSVEAFIGPTFSGRNIDVSEGSTEGDYAFPNFLSPVWFRTGVTVGLAF